MNVSKLRRRSSWLTLARLLLLPALTAACMLGGAAPSAAPTAVPAASTTLPATVSPSATLPPAPPTATAAPTAVPTFAPPAEPIAGIELTTLTEAGGLGLTQAANAHWVRWAAVWWPDVEPQEGVRNWEALSWMDDQLAAASSAGLEVILIVRGTPTWAQAKPGVACGPILPDKLAAFADFTRELVAHYSPEPFNVTYWELWNEPDIDSNLVPPDSPFGCWGDMNDPYYGGEYFAEMLKTVYPQIKAADPEAQVLSGGLVLDCDPVNPPADRDCKPSLFLEGALINGAGPYFDGVSFHAYDYYAARLPGYLHPGWTTVSNTTGPVLLAKANYLRELLTSYGEPDKFLINTESAILCGSDGTEPICQEPAAAEIKAAHIAQSFVAAAAAGLRANIWYNLTGWRGSGLVDANMAPVPAYQAYQFVASSLSQAAFRQAVEGFEGVVGYEFERAGQRLWIVWSLDNTNRPITLSETPSAVYDVYGQPQEAATQLEISFTPTYIEWGAPG